MRLPIDLKGRADCRAALRDRPTTGLRAVRDLADAYWQAQRDALVHDQELEH